MKKNFLFLFAFVMIPLLSQSLAQVNDSTKWDDDEWNDNRWWKKWNHDNLFDWEFSGTPFIEINYGLGSLKQKNMSQNFADLGDGEMKLGYSRREDFSDEKTIEFSDKYFFVSRIGSDMESTTAKANDLRLRMWRFGFAKKSGYGYKLGSFYILPYNTQGIAWSRLDMTDYPPSVFTTQYPPTQAQLNAIQDREIIDRYDGDFRFGTISESGISFDIASTIGLNAGYETSVIFPRHLFWKHIGSILIQQAGLGLLDHFIDKVADSSPLSVPFVNMILKGAYNYAFYSLQKDKMNWPFDTETPLTFDTFKVGVTFTF